MGLPLRLKVLVSCRYNIGVELVFEYVLFIVVWNLGVYIDETCLIV